jgi:predicted nucleic acid-binding protein
MPVVGPAVAAGLATSCMSDRAFLDTNVLVYALDEAEPAKRDIARRLLGSTDRGEFVLSTQILSEFYVVATRRLAQPVAEDVAAAVVDQLSRLPTVAIDPALVKNAIELSRSSQVSYWDGLILAAAAKGGCRRLLTEDLNAGQTIGSVQIENPFLALK